MKFVVIVLLLAVTTVSLVSGHAVPQNCSARYQSALREALEIKSECGDAPAYDCCQVNCNFKTMTVCDYSQIIVQKCLRRNAVLYSSPDLQQHGAKLFDHASATAIAADGLSTMRIHVCLAFTIPQIKFPANFSAIHVASII